MLKLDLTADELIEGLLASSDPAPICLLDSCGAGHLSSHLTIAGAGIIETEEISSPNGPAVINRLGDYLEGERPCIFTISYALGAKLLGIPTLPTDEPDVFVAAFDSLIVHDADSGTTAIFGHRGDSKTADELAERLSSPMPADDPSEPSPAVAAADTTRDEYIAAVEEIREHIREGITYQTNLTRQISARLPQDAKPRDIYRRLRRRNPAPFAAYIERPNSTVISASPERFFRYRADSRRIDTSPVKGTRPRGSTAEEDLALKCELLNSRKDRAENTMIVDLLRNDIGRIAEFGSVEVEELCALETHPTYHQLVSTISATVRPGTTPAEMIRSLFPCGSITGAPKISTMRIIDSLERSSRGLSMGAIGYYCPQSLSASGLATLDLSVAIRTMVVRGSNATFNVGGGIVIDSDPAAEFEETLVKSRALLDAVNAAIK